jgi:glycine/D-amino acid oxidase-like deaminating enzyme
MYDVAIVGGGIAGLAIAEIFARAGRRTVLIERSSQLCQGASASQHGWFHFGSLYSIFPQNQFLRTMIGGVEDLLEFYSAFPGMNIAVGPDGSLSFPQQPESWFRDEPIEYICCARNDPDFDMRKFEGMIDYVRKSFFLLTWEFAIKQFISRHQRFHRHNWAGQTQASAWIPRAGWMDYSRDVITKPNIPCLNLDSNTHFRILGFDRPMRAMSIVADLICSFLASGGVVVNSTAIDRIENFNNSRVLHSSDGSIRARRVIISSGRWLGEFLPKSTGIRVVCSPLLVTYPRVADINFVRMTPFVERSVNHLHHEIDGHCYSVIGGGYSADACDKNAILTATEDLKAMANNIFPALNGADLIETYLGYKTEIVASRGERNYQYFIRDIDEGVTAVVPGKFSLAFSLAVNTFKRITGESPPKNIADISKFSAVPYIGPTEHAAIIRKAFEEAAVQPRP